jgi:histidinol-phosphatase
VTEPSTADVLAFAVALAGAADEVTMGYFGGDAGVRAKDDGTLVTRADTETEALLRERITGRFPDHAILGEEEAAREGAEGAPRWILDPVDGTHNFARGIEVWATLIAFERDGVLEVGVVSAPAMRTRWWAGRGSGAFRGELPAAEGGADGTARRLRTSDRASMGDAQVLYGSYYRTMDRWGGRADRLLRSAWRTRGFGDFWGHMVVAEGKAEVMLEAEIEPYDIAAVVPIIEEAGGRLTDQQGTATIDARHCVTTNGALHDEVLRVLRG